MEHQRIELDDLINPSEDIKVDITTLVETVNPVHTLINDEIASFLEKPREEKQKPATHFFTHVPSSELKDTIDKLLKNKNKQEDRARKHLQFEFDRKMQRINKIKSKTYRKMKRKEKIRKEEELGALLDESSQNDQSSEHTQEDSEISTKEEEIQQEPLPDLRKRQEIDLEQSIPAILTRQQEQVMSIFEGDEAGPNEQEFLAEKEAVVEADAPMVTETVLPGWDEWAGEGLLCRKTSKNTIFHVKDGIRKSDRKDFKHTHLIVNENVTVPEKYKSELPYGYSYKAYKEKMNVPISSETTSARIFRKFVKSNNKTRVVPGKSIEPAEYEPEY